MRFTTDQLAQLADQLAPYGWTVGRELNGTYYATTDDHNVTLGDTKGSAGSHLLAMVAASQTARQDTAS